MSKLIEVRGPSAQEAEQGAEIVFVRVDGGVNAYIKACWTDGSYQQWGAPTPILGDNVEAVRLWAEGITALHELIRDDDEEDEAEDTDEDIASRAGYKVTEPDQGTFRYVDPRGEECEDNFGSEPWAWEAARQDYEERFAGR